MVIVRISFSVDCPFWVLMGADSHDFLFNGLFILPLRVQKVALRAILGDEYQSYENALDLTELDNLAARRSVLSLNFAKKCIKNERASDMFPLKPDHNVNSRRQEMYKVTKCRTSRFAKSAIPSMQAQLNLNASKKLKK